MKTTNYLKSFIVSAAALVFASTGSAQDNRYSETQPPQDTKPVTASQPRDRGNMFRQLGLTEEQVEQIRQIKADRRPLMEEAQKKFREANRALDEAIYADQVNEADIQARLKEVQLAQAEVSRIRFTNELSVRQILTQEQLVRFREMRRKFEHTRSRPRRDFDGDRQFKRRHPRNHVKPAQDPQQPIQRTKQEKPVL